MSIAAIGVVPSWARGVLKRTALRGAATAVLAVAAIGPVSAAEVTVPLAAAAMPLATPVLDADRSTVYRAVGARHLYDSYGQRIFKGTLPPLLYAIAIIDTEIDEDGHVVSAVVTREPAAAKEVVPWILGLIHGASPFPKPGRAGRTRYHDIWLVDHSYTFQLHTLTEGQQ